MHISCGTQIWNWGFISSGMWHCIDGCLVPLLQNNGNHTNNSISFQKTRILSNTAVIAWYLKKLELSYIYLISTKYGRLHYNFVHFRKWIKSETYAMAEMEWMIWINNYMSLVVYVYFFVSIMFSLYNMCNCLLCFICQALPCCLGILNLQLVFLISLCLYWQNKAGYVRGAVVSVVRGGCNDWLMN